MYNKNIKLNDKLNNKYILVKCSGFFFLNSRLRSMFNLARRVGNWSVWKKKRKEKEKVRLNFRDVHQRWGFMWYEFLNVARRLYGRFNEDVLFLPFEFLRVARTELEIGFYSVAVVTGKSYFTIGTRNRSFLPTLSLSLSFSLSPLPSFVRTKCRVRQFPAICFSHLLEIRRKFALLSDSPKRSWNGTDKRRPVSR